jgi:hypothetical protein
MGGSAAECAQLHGEHPVLRRYVHEGEIERLHKALRELINAGEPFVGDAFPVEKLDGRWLRIFNRWQAAMNDGRAAERDA